MIGWKFNGKKKERKMLRLSNWIESIGLIFGEGAEKGETG